jgi:hypothetical protein
MDKILYSLNKWFLFGIVALLSACSVAQEFEITREPPLLPTSTSPSLAQPDHVPASATTEILPEQTPAVAAVSTEAATVTAIAVKTPEPPPLPTVTTSATLLEGPLIAYVIQNGERYLLLLDIGTLTFREVKQGPSVINALHWLDNGCLLFTGRNVIDLHGNIVEKIDDPESEERFQVTVLSPDKQRGVRDMFLGSQTGVELDYLTLEIFDRAGSNIPVALAPNGGAYAYAWSPDGKWLAFTDFDENFVLQLYRATLDGQVVEQLTSHLEDPGVIDIIEWSPDGQQIAYAAQAILPSQYARGGSIGLISLLDLRSMVVKPDSFQYAKGLWWDENGERIAFVGQGFSSTPDAPPESQIHWVDSISGTILNSFYEHQVLPPRHFNLVTPVGNLDTIFFEAVDGYYLLDAVTNSYQKILNDIPGDGLILDFTASPFSFPGELNCQP